MKLKPVAIGMVYVGLLCLFGPLSTVAQGPGGGELAPIDVPIYNNEGTVVSGNLQSLATVDGNDYVVSSALVPTGGDSESDTQVDFDASGVATTNGGEFQITASYQLGDNSGASPTMFFYLWNWNTNQYDVIGEESMSQGSVFNFVATPAQMAVYQSSGRGHSGLSSALCELEDRQSGYI